VAFVNQDDIPNIVHIGDRSFDSGASCARRGSACNWLDLTLTRARKALADAMSWQ